MIREILEIYGAKSMLTCLSGLFKWALVDG
jgi:hypothetical protein